MKAEVRWFMTMLVVTAVAPVPPVEADYVQSGPTAWTVDDNPANTQTSTMGEYTKVVTDSLPRGYCYCYVNTYAWAKAVDSALAAASGTAYWEVSWEWEGPPSTPPGGDLSWDLEAEGSADAWGNTDPGDGGSAYSEADASSFAWLARSAGTASGGISAYGDVQNSQTGYVDYDVLGEPDQATLSDFNREAGKYLIGVDWKMREYNDDTIASGTSYVQVLAGAYADDSPRTPPGPGSCSPASSSRRDRRRF
ncbi:MAG: hypothetical protein JW741_04800 [Sedimentisphaerales bacterium]|nr:hypothetical protein [Sedimentisphaerales bacterium]